MARGDTPTAKKGKTKRSTVRSKRKPNNPKEALAWLYTIAEHIGETLKAYGAHKPSAAVADDGVESYAAARTQRDQWLSDVRRLSWFADAVKAYLSEGNKKSLGGLLGLGRGPGNPGGRRKPGKSHDLARKISAVAENILLTG